ncbi:methyl-accepting chemotaxis protein [Clostridium sp. AF37-5]|uniref:methyl-accepting chemotaxis protein n=1 Tax=Clostridium sp. AF37-5 TaxID=2293016 RepID=UPI000E4759F8|nr:methyl-accepting chemotaxis protein [Clostridium sp. AF37-5]RHO98535.1 methyl-accepting chemotaxis protein [Clostridium sp. AF37-5]
MSGWEGIYAGEPNTHVIVHNNPKIVGMTTRKGEALKQLQDAMKESDRLYNAGIIVSPASKKLTLSMYCPVYKGDEMIGYVGGGPFGEQLQKSLDALKVEGLDNASFTMINTKTNTYIFSKDSKKIAKEIKDPMLLNISESAKKGAGNQVHEIDYQDADGKDCVGVYRVLNDRGWAVVMTDTEDEIFAMANTNRNTLGFICLGSFLLIMLLTYVVIRFCLNPLKVAENAILNLKDLKLNKDEKIEKYVNGKSEIGHIATAIDSLYRTFDAIIDTLNSCSVSLLKSAEKITSSSEELYDCVGDNAATVEQVVAGVTLTEEAVEQVGKEIGRISELVSDVGRKVSDGSERSEELIQEVQKMKDTANQSLDANREKMVWNENNIEKAMKELQSLSRINEMVDRILEITSQTNLLSLNASIEAARAGEAGKGFAVVASEIGNLALSSSETATEIQTICKDANKNIDYVRQCFVSILDYWKTDVTKQFTDFIEMSNEYSTSIGSIEELIRGIQNVTDSVSDGVVAICNQMERVEGATEENSQGMERIIDKIETTKTSAEAISSVTHENQKNAEEIRDIVKKFTK